MENALRACCKGIKIGKILIHREGDDGKQVLLMCFASQSYSSFFSFPQLLLGKFVLQIMQK